MTTAILLRFDETVAAIRPADSSHNLEDLAIEAGIVAPAIVDAAVGRGRRFIAANGSGFRAQDKVSGSTLLTRDISIQVILNWQLAAQSLYGSPGSLYARGKGTGAAEYLSAGLELRVVTAEVGELRWLWQDTAGVVKTQLGGHFTPHASEYTLLTATRRWVSSGEVVLRYFLGDQLINEITSIDGSIGGGTTGTTSIGTRYTGAAWDRFLDGTIDELRVVDYELTPEEIEATFRRITVHQPRGYTLLKELHDPGFPISDDPGSRVQRETRQWGHGLGYASAQAANVRENILPDRAYGEVLEQWEGITAQPPKPGDSVDTRRTRVVGRIRQDLGMSIPGLGAALEELVDTDPGNLEILAFSPTTVDDYATGLNALRWQYDPAAQWSLVAGQLAGVTTGAQSIPFDGTTRSWYTARMAIGGGGRGVHILTKLDLTTWSANSEAGVWIGNLALGDLLLVNLKYSAAGPTVTVTTEFFQKWVSQGEVTHSAAFVWTVGGAWLHVTGQEPPNGTNYLSASYRPKFTVAWSTVAEIGPYTSVADIEAPTTWGVVSDSTPRDLNWAGLHIRSVGGAATIAARYDNVQVRAPYGDRAFWVYVYRDPALPGKLDLEGANSVFRELKQAHTAGGVITATTFLADDPDSLADLTPMGAI